MHVVHCWVDCALKNRPHPVSEAFILLHSCLPTLIVIIKRTSAYLHARWHVGNVTAEENHYYSQVGKTSTNS